MLKNNRRMLLIILFSLLIRFYLDFLPGFKIDIDDWVLWAIRLEQVGLERFYSSDVFSDYAPGYLYVLAFLRWLSNSLGFDLASFYYLVKLPGIIFEILIGIFIYLILYPISRKFALLGMTLVLFNPAFIFNSTIWGQVDSILTLFALISIFFLIRGKLLYSSFCYSLALIIKPQALALLPVFVFYYTGKSLPDILTKFLIPITLVMYSLSLPFFPEEPLINLFKHVINSANTYPYTSLFAYNFWGVMGFWVHDSTTWSGLSYQQLGLILLASYWIIISYLYFKKKLSIYAVATLATLAFFFLPTRVHERYLYPALVFLILLSAIIKSKLLLILTSFLSLFHFLNLYYVYVYYNKLYFNLPTVLYNPILYNFLDSNGRLLSAVSTVIFLIITYVIKKIKA